jgi:hypothetical protein
MAYIADLSPPCARQQHRQKPRIMPGSVFQRLVIQRMRGIIHRCRQLPHHPGHRPAGRKKMMKSAAMATQAPEGKVFRRTGRGGMISEAGGIRRHVFALTQQL